MKVDHLEVLVEEPSMESREYFEPNPERRMHHMVSLEFLEGQLTKQHFNFF